MGVPVVAQPMWVTAIMRRAWLMRRYPGSGKLVADLTEDKSVEGP
jgi:hypothetical protein